MIKILYTNYEIIRQILPHPVWFSDLTGVNARVADNVLSGVRKISVRHMIRIARSFGLEDERFQFPIAGALDPDEPMNLARRAWLCAHVARCGNAKIAGARFPGLGWKTLKRMLDTHAIVSPIMCELIARHTGWPLPEDLLHASVTAREPQLQHAETLLGLMRLQAHHPVVTQRLPARTCPSEMSIAPDVRFAAPDYATLEQVIAQGPLDLTLRQHYWWLKKRIHEADSAGTLSDAEVRALRRMMQKKRTQHLLQGHATRMA